jgi:hypothetical protein
LAHVQIGAGQKTSADYSYESDACPAKALEKVPFAPISVLLFESVNEIGYMATTMPIYKVVFYNQNQVYEVYAKAIYQSEMYGFIEVEEFVFGERAQIVVDPGEEKLKSEFAGVKRSYIPLHSVIRIDEVEKEGMGKVIDVKSGDKVSPFPVPGLVPKPGKDS